MSARTATSSSADEELTRELFREWRSHNEAHTLETQSYGMIACMTAMIPLDYIFFPPALAPWCTLLRLIAITTAGVSLLVARLFSSKPQWRFFAPWILLPTPVVATLAHLLLVYWGPYESRITTIIVTFGPCFAFYLSCFRIFKYLRQFAAFTLTCLAASAIVAWTNPAVLGEVGVFVFAIFGTFTMFLVSRRVFSRSLLAKYRNLLSLQPAIVAKRLTVSDKRLVDDEMFQARDRFTVCFSSDWRNYQEMTVSREPKMISRLFEVYYNIVFEELANAAPSGRYYADWTADEIMVIFYGESEEQRETVIEEALEFARKMATEVPERVRDEMSIVLKYDIGIATGVGYLGLQGPSERRKTTIAGEVAGTAKRLETEGKDLRSRGFDDDYPNVVMDQTIGAAASAAASFREGWKTELTAAGKNIKGMNITLWRCGSHDQEASPSVAIAPLHGPRHRFGVTGLFHFPFAEGHRTWPSRPPLLSALSDRVQRLAKREAGGALPKKMQRP